VTKTTLLPCSKLRLSQLSAQSCLFCFRLKEQQLADQKRQQDTVLLFQSQLENE